MASEITTAPQALSPAASLAADAQFSTSDYGAVGDQRPYQIVQPAYPAPRFLARYSNLSNALRECGTLCQLTGQPFRLVKWGGRLPCYPCRSRKTANSLPSVRIHSPGALAGYPNSAPVADFTPGGTTVYDRNGQPHVIGAPGFVVSRTPFPATSVSTKGPLPQRYAEAVRTAQLLSAATGRTTYICSSLGANCDPKNKQQIPVVYVEPGGLVKRFPSDLTLTGSTPGSIAATTSVTEDEFRELVRQSAGQSRLGQGA